MPFILEEKMNFDYCEFEKGSAQAMEIYIGCRFIDEPEELYVIHVSAHQDGNAKGLKLLFNGMDCKYSFKAEEKASIVDYIHSTLPDTEYVDWFEGSVKL
jgi:hypothetical protein